MTPPKRKAGRPSVGAKRFTVNITDQQRRVAYAIGKGNAGRGVRLALDKAGADLPGIVP